MLNIARFKRPLGIIFGGAAILFISLAMFPIAAVIIILNALFIASMFGIIFAYHRLIWASVFGDPPYNRAQQYALGVFLWGFALILGASTSVWIRVLDAEPTAYFTVAAARHAAIIGAWCQVTAPAFGEGFFAGSERKVLWSAVTISTIIAIILIMLQFK